MGDLLDFLSEEEGCYPLVGVKTSGWEKRRFPLTDK